jgi:ribonuclease HI
MLIEVKVKARIERFDLFLSSPDTTNNRMALSGAIAAFALLSRKERRLAVRYVSDSEYLVKGMRDWVPGWRARGWRRRGGDIENLELWQALSKVADAHDVRWLWVRGHAGDPKNEFADWLAVRSARDQLTSEGAVPSGFPAWLAERQARGRYAGYDPDQAFDSVGTEVAP